MAASSEGVAASSEGAAARAPLDDDVLDTIFEFLPWPSILHGPTRCAARPWRAAALRVASRRREEIIDALCQWPSVSRDRFVAETCRAMATLAGQPVASVAAACEAWFEGLDDEAVSNAVFELTQRRGDGAATYADVLADAEENASVLHFVDDLLIKRHAKSARRVQRQSVRRFPFGATCETPVETRRAIDGILNEVLSGLPVFADRSAAVAALAGPIGASRKFFSVFVGLHRCLGGEAYVRHVTHVGRPAEVQLMLDRAQLLVSLKWDRADVATARQPLLFFTTIQDLAEDE